MSESIAPPPGAKRSRRAAQASERKGENETSEFERRRAELALLLIGLDREFWKRGMSEAIGHDSGTGKGRPPQGRRGTETREGSTRDQR